MKRWMYIAGGIVLLLVVVVVGGMHYAARSIKQSIEEALGPEGQAAEIAVRLTSIELVDIRIAAPKGWPTDTALRAKRVVIVPDLRQLMSDHVEVTRIDVEGGYLSAFRPPAGGGLRVLPSIAERAKKRKRDSEGRRGATVGTVALSGTVIEVFDAATVGKPTKLRIDAVKGTIKDIRVPELDVRTRIALAGTIKGPSHSGTIAMDGWTHIAAKAAEMSTRVKDVDLALFEPYLVTKLKSGVDAGTFNLDLKSKVQKNVVDASGTLTVVAVKLRAADNPLQALAGITRRAAIGALEDDYGQITVPFEVHGNLDDPTFSLAGETRLKTGIAVAKALGLSFEGVVRAVLIILNGLGSAFFAFLPG